MYHTWHMEKPARTSLNYLSLGGHVAFCSLFKKWGSREGTCDMCSEGTLPQNLQIGKWHRGFPINEMMIRWKMTHPSC